MLRLTGEIDRLTLPAVQSAFTDALDQRPPHLVVDLAGVRFCCVRGFTLIETTAYRARSSEIGYALSGLTRHLSRVATLLWPDGQVARYRSVAAAVTAMRIDQTSRTA